MYDPLDPTTKSRLGDRLLGPGKCAFITAGNRAYLPAVSCVARRLDAVQSQYPLLIMVQPEDEDFMRAHIYHGRHPDSMILSWQAFPVGSRSVGIRGLRLMDKINVHGLPARRLVWIDADMYVRRNLDELCELPADIDLAAAFNAAGGLPSYVWSEHTLSRFPPNRKPCLHKYNITLDATKYTFLRSHELRPPPWECPYMFNTGLFVVRPLNLSTFNAAFVEPMRNGSIATYDGTDQGIINTLLYGRRKLWGDHWAVLHPRLNNIAGHSKHAEAHWRGISTVIYHYTGKSGRPWLGQGGSSAKSWHEGCPRNASDVNQTSR
jgi:hypothetical protein